MLLWLKNLLKISWHKSQFVEGEAKVDDASKVDNTDDSVDTNESGPLGPLERWERNRIL